LGEIDALGPLKSLVMRENGGRGRVTVIVPLPPQREVEVALPGGFKISPRIRAAVKSLPGILDVHDV
jgi:DNA polymerase-3 subunit alpha